MFPTPLVWASQGPRGVGKGRLKYVYNIGIVGCASLSSGNKCCLLGGSSGQVSKLAASSRKSKMSEASYGVCRNYSLSNHAEVAYILVSANLIASVVGTCGNLLVCAAVFTSKGMASSFHYFIVSLAAADLTIALADQPMLVVLILGRVRSECLPNLDTAFRVVGNLACAVSLLTLASIALDRCLFVTQACRYKNTMTRGKVLALTVVWTLAGVYTALRLTIDKKITSFLTAAMFGLCYCGMFFCYLVTYYSVWKTRKLLLPRGEPSRNDEKDEMLEDNRMERQFARTVVMVVVVFSVSWFLLFYLRLTQPEKNYGIMYNIARTVALSSSAFNPVLYCLTTRSTVERSWEFWASYVAVAAEEDAGKPTRDWSERNGTKWTGSLLFRVIEEWALSAWTPYGKSACKLLGCVHIAWGRKSTVIELYLMFTSHADGCVHNYSILGVSCTDRGDQRKLGAEGHVCIYISWTTASARVMHMSSAGPSGWPWGPQKVGVTSLVRFFTENPHHILPHRTC